MNVSSGYLPDHLVPSRLSEASLARRKAQQKRRAEAFIMGPIPVAWVARAAALQGKAWAVGAAIWFEAGCSGSRSGLKICTSLLERFGISRKAGYRGLTALEQAGLVAVERQRGRCPRVTIKITKGKP